MSREMMTRNIYDRLSHFKLSGNAIFHIVELADRRKAELPGTDEYREAGYNLRGYVSMLTEAELQELMCLMDFGRELSYKGFCSDTVEGFLDHLKTNHFSHIEGKHAVDYVAGKIPLGDWLRLVLVELRNRYSADDFYRLTFYEARAGARDHAVDFANEAEAWAAMRDAVGAEASETYSCITLVGHSLKGRAETHLATVNLG